MSERNLEIVRAAAEAFDKGDWDAALKDASADFEYDLSRANGPFRGVFGLDETRRFMREFEESWESADYSVDEFIEAGEHVVTPVTFRFRGRGGIDVKARPAFVWTIRDGKLSRICMYQERDEAVAAAGLTAEG